MFPNNSVLSGVSIIGATQTQHGHIKHDYENLLIISDFENPNVPKEKSVIAAKKFVELYKASGKAQCYYNQDTGYVRRRKLVYNASFNAACAITGMDASRMKLYGFPIKILIRPLMQEIVAVAKKPDTDCLIIISRT
jgi:ketopantoate reductase